MSEATPDRARGRRNLLILAAVFLVPFFASFALYFGGIWKPESSAAKGALLDPPRILEVAGLRNVDGTPADEHALHRKWSIVYIGDAACDETCRTALTYGRQTRLALNKDMTRVQRVLLSTGNCCDQAYFDAEQPGLVILDATAPEAAEFLAAFPGPHATSVYIVDPHGNLIMRHEATRVVNKDLLKDLQKLLKLSHIG